MEHLIFADGHGQLSFRWAHLLAGVVWIGMLYFFNWVGGPFQASLDKETRQRVVPELMPRALYWFRWGAAWTWFTGVCLLFTMYYVRDTGLFLASPPLEGPARPEPSQWGPPFALLFAGFLVYDQLFKWLGSRSAVLHHLCVLVFGALAVGFHQLCLTRLGLSGRAALIHVGALFGTVMAANVWMRIWPAQQRIVLAVRDGREVDPADSALAGMRSRHNTYMSVPLLFLMVSVDQAGAHQLDAQGLALVLVVAWVVTFALYRRAAGVGGA